MATLTGGEYHPAQNAKALTDTLLDLPNSIALQHRKVEITVWFALAGAVCALLAVGLAQWWTRPRPLPGPPPG